MGVLDEDGIKTYALRLKYTNTQNNYGETELKRQGIKMNYDTKLTILESLLASGEISLNEYHRHISLLDEEIYNEPIIIEGEDELNLAA